MVSTPAVTPVTFKSMGRDNRREVMRLAKAGEPHANPAMAAAVYRWSHAKRWNSLANRLPGWLLPSVGVVYLLLAILTGLPLWFGIGGIGGIVVVVIGLLGWINTSGARSLRAVYVDESLVDEGVVD